MIVRLIVKFLFLSLVFLGRAQNVKLQIHSHNDYEQEYPLITALSNNFNSIEVDIFDYDDKIVVSHDDDDLNKKPTLSQLYLDPLSKYPFEENQTIILLIDLKIGGHKILHDLHDLLSTYPNMFKNRGEISQDRPIQIILSGSVDKDYVISNQSFIHFFIDGRPNDLTLNYSSHLMPLISSNIEDFLKWKSNLKVSESQLKPILNIIEKTHQQGKMIRFWNTSDSPKLWDLLIAMQVDMIGVDNISGFIDYSNKFSRN